MPTKGYIWVADRDDLQDGKLVTNFRLALLNWTDPRTGKPAKQKVLSIISGVPESRISEYAQGRRPIPTHHLILFAKIMQMSPEDLIGVVEQ